MLNKLKDLPTGPGVYLMKGKKSEILYVGKAINLRSRVRSYFQKNTSIKTAALVKRIEDVDVILVENEVEALLLERSLIKEHQPPYNILLRDDKEFPWLRIDMQNPWPRIQKVRQRKNDGSTYLGPYTHVGHLDTMLRLTSSVFPFIRCSEAEFRQAKRPCNYYDIKRCLAPCCGKINSDDYHSMMKNAISFLKGDTKKVFRDLKKKMTFAAEQEQYEVAARYRDQMLSLEKATAKQSIVLDKDENIDCFAIARTDDYAFIHILQVRSGTLTGQTSHFIQTSNVSESDPLRDFLLLYNDMHEGAEKLLIDHDLKEKKLAKAIGCPISKPTTPVEKQLVETAQRNALYELTEYQRTTFGRQAALDMVQQRLSLSKYPKNMVCIDISNLQHSAIVASVVYFQDGKPEKSRYRIYHIKSLEQNHDDYQSIREVVTRYIARAQENNDLPDLLLIDGGKGQLQAALDACASLAANGLHLEIASIAKARTSSKQPERIYRPNISLPVVLKPGDSDYRLLTNLRDEAHRFALHHHRKKRSKNAHLSILDGIKGVGPALKKKLFDHFQTIEAMKKSSFDAFTSIPGISETIALNIQTALQEDDCDSHTTENRQDL